MALAHLDPQVQIRVIDLAAKWVEETKQTSTGQVGQETLIKRRTERFDQAYKALTTTVKDAS